MPPTPGHFVRTSRRGAGHAAGQVEGGETPMRLDSARGRRYQTEVLSTESSLGGRSGAPAGLGVPIVGFVRTPQEREKDMLSIQGFPAGLRQEIHQSLTLIRRRLAHPPAP